MVNAISDQYFTSGVNNMSNVQVLCPNGRRQNVKVNPNTKLLQVLEEVCKKQGFLPPEDYKLVQGRKTYDVTLSIRYANLPNIAKLELVKSETSRSEADVLIALQLESGERLQHSFPPVTTLWQILQHWESIDNSPHRGVLTQTDTSHDPPIQPTCIYMRDEVIGEPELQSTTLRKLGLTSGKAVIRLVHRPVDDAVMKKILEKLDREKTQLEKLNEIAKRQTSQDESKQPLTNLNSVPDTSSANSAVVKTERENVCSSSKSSETVQGSNKPEPMEQEQMSDNVPMETDSSTSSSATMEVEMKSNSEAADNARKDDISKTQDTKTSEPKAEISVDRSTQQRQTEFVENIRQMNIPGLQIFTPNDFNDLTPEEQQVARRLAAHYMPQMGIQTQQQQQLASGSGTKPKRKKPPQDVRPFADFKFPEETKGQDLYRNELSEVNKEEFKPCDRQACLYSTEEVILSSSTNTDLPDDFFEVTENDVKKMYVDQQRKLKEGAEQPLMTRTMIQLKQEEKYSKYQQVIIRVQFPDKIVLQGLFRPRETVFAIQKFVKEHLEDKGQEFYLYTSPPKNVLTDRAMSLIDAKLAPATLVYFGSEVVKDHYLSAAVLKEVGPRVNAEEIVEKVLSTEKEGQQSPEDSSNNPKPGPSKSKKNQSKPSQSNQDGKHPNVPKWFVMGKK